MAETHVELPGSRRSLATGARRVRDIDPHAHVEVTVMLKAPALPALGKMPAHTMSPQELAREYGAAPKDIRTGCAQIFRPEGRGDRTNRPQPAAERDSGGNGSGVQGGDGDLSQRRPGRLPRT